MGLISNSAVLVSVVVPTIGRDSLLPCIVSVVKQSVPTEILVVLDRPEREPYVRELLDGLEYNVLLTAGGMGGAHARNMGLARASGDYIAYLDDDDVWEHNKLSIQLESLSVSPTPSRTISVTATKFVREVSSGTHESVVPTENFDLNNEDIVDYLVERRDLRYGRKFMQTSSILGPSELLKEYRWDESLRKHQDWDLFSRLLAPNQGVLLSQLERPLVHVHQHSVGSLSASFNWKASSLFFSKFSNRMCPRNRADFLWSQVLRASLAERSYSGLWFALKNINCGVPHMASIVVAARGLFKK